MKLFLPFLILIFSCFPILSGCKFENASIIMTHIIMAIICVRNLFANSKRPYSLFIVLNLFFLFFMCIAPAVQLNNGVAFFETKFSFDNYFATSFTLLFVLITTTFVYGLCSKKYDCIYGCSRTLKAKSIFTHISLKKELLMLIVSGSICFTCLYLNHFNISSLLFRGGELTRVSTSQIFSLFFNNFFKPMPLVIFLASLVIGVKHRLIIFMLFVCLLISVPPTGVARLLAAAIYIPVVLFLLPFIKKRNNFVLFFCFGILVVFPLLNVFRFYSEQLSFDISTCFSQFEDLHFDAYSMMMRVIKDDIVTYGNQLIGALLFWVPRSVWPSKPVGSGYFVAEQTNLSFNNISMPFWGEGYINFGFFGVALFTIVLAVFIARAESKFWNITVKQERNLDTILYYLLLGLLMFVLRGDMMSGTAYTCGIICSYYFIEKIVL